MPIKPERRALYPSNWRAISELVRENADDRCQECGVCNKAVGYRDTLGAFVGVPGIDRPTVLAVLRSLRGADARLTRIVLTVHHRDGDPTNNRRENLVALCQQCHLRADRQLQRQADAARLACANCWAPIADEGACWRNAAAPLKTFCSSRCADSWRNLRAATVTRESLAEAPRGPSLPSIDTGAAPLPDLLARFCQCCWRPLAFPLRDGQNHYCSMECAFRGPRPWPNSEAAAEAVASAALEGCAAAGASVLLAHRRQDSPETAERATMNREGDDHGAD